MRPQRMEKMWQLPEGYQPPEKLEPMYKPDPDPKPDRKAEGRPIKFRPAVRRKER